MRSLVIRNLEFVSNVAVLTSGKAMAAAIALLTVPIVARLYSPADFGIAASFVAATSMLSTVAALRYGAAIVLPKSDTNARRIVALSLRIIGLFCLALLLVIAGLVYWGTDLSFVNDLAELVWLLPLAVALTAIGQLQESWLTRKKAFGRTSAAALSSSLSNSGTRIACGAAFGSSVAGLLAGEILALVARILAHGKNALQTILSCVMPQSKGTLSSTAREYRDFPTYNAPAGLLFSIGQNLPVMLLGSMFSPFVAGLYAMARRLLQVPVTIVATSTRGVFLQKSAEIVNNQGPLWRAYLYSVAALAALGVVPFSLIFFYGQPFSVAFLGNDWAQAGQYLEVISPWLYFVWVSAPCNPIFVVLRRQKLWLTLTTSLTVLRLSAFWFAYQLDLNAIDTVEFFVIATVCGNIIILLTTAALTTHRPKPPNDTNITL